jgi:hypothetical protein
MNKGNLIKISSHFRRYCTPGGNIEIIEERYADPRKPNRCKLWVVNGQHEFKQQGHCRTYMSMLAERIGGDGKFPDDESYKQAYSKIVPTYTEEVRNAAILG